MERGQTSSLKEYLVEGECVPKARPSFNRYGGTYGKAFERQKAYEQFVALRLKEQGAKPSKKALLVKVDVYKGFLKSWTKKQQQEAKQGKLRPVKRPDIDNYVKSVLDGANGILWEDDSQIVSLLASKHYAETPQVTIGVQEL